MKWEKHPETPLLISVIYQGLCSDESQWLNMNLKLVGGKKKDVHIALNIEIWEATYVWDA